MWVCGNKGCGRGQVCWRRVTRHAWQASVLAGMRTHAPPPSRSAGLHLPDPPNSARVNFGNVSMLVRVAAPGLAFHRLAEQVRYEHVFLNTCAPRARMAGVCVQRHRVAGAARADAYVGAGGGTPRARAHARHDCAGTDQTARSAQPMLRPPQPQCRANAVARAPLAACTTGAQACDKKRVKGCSLARHSQDTLHA